MFRTVLLFTATFLTACSAGLLFAYACSVNPGLHQLSDPAYLAAMQSINRAIQNPVFFVCFLGPVALLPWSAWRYRIHTRSFRFLLLAAGCYILGVFAVTMLGNVPLNQMLDAFDIGRAAPAALATERAAFEPAWSNWHLLRTVAALLAAGLALAAVFSGKTKD